MRVVVLALLLGAAPSVAWWGWWDEIGVSINNLTLMRPEYQGNSEEVAEDEEEEEEDADTAAPIIDTDEGDEDEEEEYVEDTGTYEIDPGAEDTEDAGWFNCATAPASNKAMWPLGLAAILLGARRRETRR